MCMIDPGCERYTVLGATYQTANITHNCQECGRVIDPGESYHRECLLYDGRKRTHKTCAHCMVAREWLDRECGGFYYTMVEDDIFQHTLDGEGGAFPVLLSDGMRDQWRGEDGSLWPVPVLPCQHGKGEMT